MVVLRALRRYAGRAQFERARPLAYADVVTLLRRPRRPSAPGALAAALAAAAALLVPAAPAAADNPVIHVRARLRIDLDAVERVAGGIHLRGSLRDDASDEPVVGRVVAGSLDGPNGHFWQYAEPTGPDGSFRWRVPLPMGPYRLRIAAGGDSEYLAAAPVERAIDVSRRTPTLTVQVPARVGAHAGALHVVVEAHESDGMGPPRAYEGHVALTVGGTRRTDLVVQDGRAERDVSGPFGHPGTRIDVIATIDEDPERSGASALKPVLLTTPTSLTFVARPPEVSPDDELGVAGRLTDDDGPVAGAEVTVGLENGADLAHFTTDGSGVYNGRLPGRDLPTGAVFVEARVHPTEDWREGTASPTVPLDVLPAPPIAVWPYIVSPALTLLVALVAFAARDRRWRRYLAVGRRARRIATLPPDGATPGLTESRRGILSSLRRPDHGFSGVVVDAADDRPIPTATLVARASDGVARAAAVDERGRFAFEELPAGPLVVEVAAPGYVAEAFSRALPHRGELRGARVRLVPVRARIFDAWRRAATPLYPMGRSGDTMTPRELLAYVEKKRMLPHEPLAALTSLVEAAVWGSHAPSLDDLADAERLASTLRADA